MNVDINSLRRFQQVAEGMTVTEVSDLGAVTQSGVSRALRRLEAEVGTPLLRLPGRTLRMTHAGARFSNGTLTRCCTSSTTGSPPSASSSSPTPAPSGVEEQRNSH